MPAGSGVISHTTLFTQQNEIYILDPDHADARVGSRHTNGIIYLELIRREKDTIKEVAHFEVYKPASPQENVKKKFFIDLNSSLLEKLYEERAVDERNIAAISKTEGQRFIKLDKRYDQLLRELKPNTSLILQDFPTRRLASYLTVAADLGLLSDLTFRRAPEEEYFFRSEHLVFMNTLQDMGVEIHWKSPLQGDLVLYKQFFMRSSEIPSFHEAFSSEGSWLRFTGQLGVWMPPPRRRSSTPRIVQGFPWGRYLRHPHRRKRRECDVACIKNHGFPGNALRGCILEDSRSRH